MNNPESELTHLISNLSVEEKKVAWANANKFVYQPLVISGCSGAGKGTLVNFLL